MKKNLTLIVFLVYNSILFSQEKDSLLVGEWKVIYEETHNFSYNSVTDKLTYNKEFKKAIPAMILSFGIKDLAEFDKDTKLQVTRDGFVFEENGVYLRKNYGKTLHDGNYCIDSSKKNIYVKVKGSPEFSMKYYIKKGLLYLTMGSKSKYQTKTETIYLKPTKFILQKTKTL